MARDGCRTEIEFTPLYFTNENLLYPTYLGYIDPDDTEHVVCEFSSTDQEEIKVVASPSAGRVCRPIKERNAQT
jgi:hypothetical protein